MNHTSPHIEDEMQSLITEAKNRGICLRLIGGLAFKVRCPNANHFALKRDYPDIDFVTDKKGARRLAEFLTSQGYVPDRALNTLNGDRRQLFYDATRGRQIDIFIGDFEMCHKLPLSKRLALETVTVPLADLFLSKAQIVELNHKDALDIFALLLDYEVGHGDENTINVDWIARLCARDWGLYTTTMLTIRKLNVLLVEKKVDLTPEQIQIIHHRLERIRRVLETTSKTLGWKMRSRLGTRVRWYQEVEEVQR